MAQGSAVAVTGLGSLRHFRTDHELVRPRRVHARPPPMVNLMSQKMGIHEWSYDNAISADRRYRVRIRVPSAAAYGAATA